MPSLDPVVLADLADLADLGRGLRPADPATGVLAVRLGAGPSALTVQAARAAAACPGPVIGLLDRPAEPGDLPLLRALTCTLGPGSGPAREVVYAGDVGTDPAADLAEIAAAVTAAPHAAVTLNGVLRLTSQVGVWDGLVAESAAYSMLLGGAEFAAWSAAARRPPPPPEDDEPVLVSRADGATGARLVLTINRPGRRNAFGRAVRDGLVDALALASAEEGLAVELRGAGPDFCSGGDLAEFGTAPDIGAAHTIRLTRSVGWALHRLAGRTTVHVHGACVGAGIELPAFTSRVIAAEGSRFRLPELGMGLIPGAGGTVSVPKRIGRWRAAWWALTCRWLPAPLAAAWGLVDELLPAAGTGGAGG